MLYIKDTHCKHILIGCCNDNGYVPTLDPFKTSNLSSRIFLIQHPRPGAEYRGLPFKVARLKDVFRETELSLNFNSGTKRATSNSLSPSEPRNRTGLVKPEVLLNKDGQRIDCNLLHVLRCDLTDADKRMRSKAPRPCNIHYIFGQGTCSTVQCQHSHTERILAGEILAMALRAREVPCNMGESLNLSTR